VRLPLRRFFSSSGSVRYEREFSNPNFQLTFITLLSIVVIFSKLGGNGLANFDDCFYAQKAKEVLQTGNLMTMHYNGTPAFENPPLYMWLAAISYKIFGVCEYAAKFPSAFMGVSTIILVYFFARYLFNNWTGFFSSFVLSTTFIFTRHARHAMLDVTLSFFVCLAMFSLVLAIRKDARYFLLFGLSTGICILTKSVLGFFPFVIAAMYLLITKRWRTFFNAYFLLGCAIILSVGFSWYVHQYLTFGRLFLDIHFGWLIFQRGILLNPQPWYDHLSYFEDLLTYYWPWLPLLILGVAKFWKLARQKDERALLILIWLGTILGTMSIMKSRVLWYVMPIFPAAAVATGYALNEILKPRVKLAFMKASMCVGAAAIILLNATPLQIESEREKDVRTIAPYIKHFANRGAKVIAFRRDFYGLNNALLFYSDVAASPILQDYGDFSKAFDDTSLVLCVLSVSEVDQVLQNTSEIHVVKKTDELATISNRSLDVSEVKTW